MTPLAVLFPPLLNWLKNFVFLTTVRNFYFLLLLVLVFAYTDDISELVSAFGFFGFLERVWFRAEGAVKRAWNSLDDFDLWFDKITDEMYREQLAAARPVSARRARYLKLRKGFSARVASITAYVFPRAARRVLGGWLEYLFDRWLMPAAWCWLGFYAILWLCVYQVATIELNCAQDPWLQFVPPIMCGFFPLLLAFQVLLQHSSSTTKYVIYSLFMLLWAYATWCQLMPLEVYEQLTSVQPQVSIRGVHFAHVRGSSFTVTVRIDDMVKGACVERCCNFLLDTFYPREYHEALKKKLKVWILKQGGPVSLFNMHESVKIHDLLQAMKQQLDIIFKKLHPEPEVVAAPLEPKKSWYEFFSAVAEALWSGLKDYEKWTLDPVPETWGKATRYPGILDGYIFSHMDGEYEIWRPQPGSLKQNWYRIRPRR
jgi:hypothetical protein